MQDNVLKTGNHVPTHLLRANATYMLTASIYGNEYLMKTDLRKTEWRDSFHKAAELYQWRILAWVVLSNHYHALLRSPSDPKKSIDKFVASYHKFTATRWNKEDNQIGRAVWWNYYDSCIKDKREFFAKLNYIHWNPVKHGLVKHAEDYRFSSYRDFTQPKSAKVDYSLESEEARDVPEF
jgi:putative transposase